MATTDKRTLLTEVPHVGVYPDEETFNKLEPERQKRDKELLTDAIKDTKDARSKALDNAHKALVDAFGPKLNGMIVEKLSSEEGVTEETIDELIQELENKVQGAPDDDDMIKECRQRLNEAKNPSVPSTEKEKMYRDIHRKFWAYVQSLPHRNFTTEPRKLTEADQAVKKFMENRGGPIQWISHEGSMIICSLVAVSENGTVWVSLSQLPEGDREIIFSMTGNRVSHGFMASLDEYKNFDCKYDNPDKNGYNVNFTLGNRVASIPPHEANRFGNVDVKVERKGKDILIGDKIKLERNKIQNLVNQPDPTNNGANRGMGFVPRQKVAGRNAFEIRTDILEIAYDFIKTNTKNNMNADDVVDVAEKFYSFVENKR